MSVLIELVIVFRTGILKCLIFVFGEDAFPLDEGGCASTPILVAVH